MFIVTWYGYKELESSVEWPCEFPNPLISSKIVPSTGWWLLEWCCPFKLILCKLWVMLFTADSWGLVELEGKGAPLPLKLRVWASVKLDGREEFRAWAKAIVLKFWLVIRWPQVEPVEICCCDHPVIEWGCWFQADTGFEMVWTGFVAVINGDWLLCGGLLWCWWTVVVIVGAVILLAWEMVGVFVGKWTPFAGTKPSSIIVLGGDQKPDEFEKSWNIEFSDVKLVLRWSKTVFSGVEFILEIGDSRSKQSSHPLLLFLLCSSDSSFSVGEGKKRDVVLSACLKSTGDKVRVAWPKSAMSKEQGKDSVKFSRFANYLFSRCLCVLCRHVVRPVLTVWKRVDSNEWFVVAVVTWSTCLEENSKWSHGFTIWPVAVANCKILLSCRLIAISREWSDFL